jgi:hypothetical protein
MVGEDGSRGFSTTSFGFSDPDGDALAAVFITMLPANGTLTLDGQVVSQGQRIEAIELAGLVWTPPANANGTALFFAVLQGCR